MRTQGWDDGGIASRIRANRETPDFVVLRATPPEILRRIRYYASGGMSRGALVTIYGATAVHEALG